MTDAEGREARQYHYSEGSALLGVLASFRAPKRAILYFRAGLLESAASL